MLPEYTYAHGILQHVTGKSDGRPREIKLHALASKIGFKFGPWAHFEIRPNVGQNLAKFVPFLHKIAQF